VSPRRTLHEVRVGYVDTDQAGVVHHASYFRWLEHGRVEYLRHHGLDYRRFELDEHLALPVIEVSLRYRAPARFDELLVVETWVPEVTRAKVRFDSVIRRGVDTLLTGSVWLACVAMPEGRLVSMPESVRRACGHEEA